MDVLEAAGSDENATGALVDAFHSALPTGLGQLLQTLVVHFLVLLDLQPVFFDQVMAQLAARLTVAWTHYEAGLNLSVA